MEGYGYFFLNYITKNPADGAAALTERYAKLTREIEDRFRLLMDG